MTASSAWRTEKIQVMLPGEVINVAGFDFKFDGAQALPGPNYRATRGRFTVTRGGMPFVKLAPENRIYNVSGQHTTEAAIYSTFFGDLYAVIGDPDPERGGFVSRLYFNPLVPWMWGGVIIMVLGAGISLSDRRHRIGAPARRHQPEPGLQPAE